MRQKSVPVNEPATQVLKTIRRATRRHSSAEDKIRIVLEGLRGEDSIVELCRREGIVQNLYYRGRRSFSRRARSAWPVGLKMVVATSVASGWFLAGCPEVLTSPVLTSKTSCSISGWMPSWLCGPLPVVKNVMS